MPSGDPNWPRAHELLVDVATAQRQVVGLLGISTWQSSVSARSATSTPVAVREALTRFSTYVVDGNVDLLDQLSVVDLGDVDDPDGPGVVERVSKAFAKLDASVPCVILGGDNSATVPGLLGRAEGSLENWGLVTIDPHLDVREGHSNGSPVRELIEAGLDPRAVVQVGTSDFVNSRHYAQWADSKGITRISRSQLDRDGTEATIDAALEIASAGGRRVYVDLDVDSVDQSEAPGCPAAIPGGLSGSEFRSIARLIGWDDRVAAIDLTEIDVERDAPDQRTVRLAALTLLEFLAGVVKRG